MALLDGTGKIKGAIYDMSGQTTYDPDDGVYLGKTSDLIMPEFERDVTVYARQGTGSTPAEASIDGSSIVLHFGLSEYTAAVMKVLSQALRPAGANKNYHGPLGAGVAVYRLGRLLDSSQTVPLLIVDSEAPADYPALYIPRAIVLKVRGLSMSFRERIMDPATFEVIGLYDSTIGDCFAWGDISSFPDLGEDEPEA